MDLIYPCRPLLLEIIVARHSCAFLSPLAATPPMGHVSSLVAKRWEVRILSFHFQDNQTATLLSPCHGTPHRYVKFNPFSTDENTVKFNNETV